MLASKRFSFALKIMTLVLFILVVVGFYYLWGRDNHCTDPKLWIVKAWFIALLVVTALVSSIVIAAMVRAGNHLMRADQCRLRLRNEFKTFVLMPFSLNLCYIPHGPI